jgi:hypothetical protein
MRTHVLTLFPDLLASSQMLAAQVPPFPPEYLDTFEAPFQHQNNHPNSAYRFANADWLIDADTLNGELEERFHSLHLALIPVGEHRGKILGWNYAPNLDPMAPPQDPLGATFWSIIDPEVAPAPGGFMNFRLDLPDTDGEKNDLACAGHTWLPNGKLLVAGGTTKYASTGHPTVSGARLLYLFDPQAQPTSAWAQVKDQAQLPVLLVKKRWYPTVTLAKDPLVLMTGGEVNGTAIGDSYEAIADWNQFVTPNNHPGPGGDAQLWGYPRQHLLSDGQVFVWTVWQVPTNPLAVSIEHHLLPGFWTAKSRFAHARFYGSGVLLPNIDSTHTDAVLQVGGINAQGTVHASAQLCKAISNNLASGFCDVPQGNQWTPVWTEPVPPDCALPNMHYQRKYLNAVLLPDASVLVVGGLWTTGDFHVAGAVKQVEILRGGTWELGQTMTTNRSYHSTAVLLPSGKVLLAAGEGRTWDYEVYVPRYLTWGKPKPQWSSQGPPWQENVQHGFTYQADFTLTGSGGVLSKVVLMRPGSVTHHFDQDQRYIQLATSVNGNTVSFTMPASSNAAPKGFYMVFLLTSDGTPSVARWINLQ